MTLPDDRQKGLVNTSPVPIKITPGALFYSPAPLATTGGRIQGMGIRVRTYTTVPYGPELLAPLWYKCRKSDVVPSGLEDSPQPSTGCVEGALQQSAFPSQSRQIASVTVPEIVPATIRLVPILSNSYQHKKFRLSLINHIFPFRCADMQRGILSHKNDSKSPFPCESVGSIPTSGTKWKQGLTGYDRTGKPFSFFRYRSFCPATVPLFCLLPPGHFFLSGRVNNHRLRGRRATFVAKLH